jgi:carbamoyltransferase
MTPHALPAPDPALAFLGPRLRALGYDEDALAARLGGRVEEYEEGLAPRDGARLAASRDPLDLAIAAFFLQHPFARAALAPLLAAGEVDALARAGLLEEFPDGRVRHRFHVYASGDLLVLTDSRLSAPIEHAVLTPGTDTCALACLLDGRGAARALDLTTGSGVHALVLARTCERVLAVDLAPRAAACARWNTWWNGVPNVDVVEGDLYAPALGARFERIVADPPFVPSPAGTCAARDGGPRGDTLARRVLAGLGRHLAPAGTATLVLAVPAGEYGFIAEELARGADGAPLAALWQSLDEASAADYAAMQADAEVGPAAGPADVAARAAHLARERITALELGVLHVRRARPGEPPLAFERARPRRDFASLAPGARAFQQGG